MRKPQVFTMEVYEKLNTNCTNQDKIKKTTNNEKDSRFCYGSIRDIDCELL